MVTTTTNLRVIVYHAGYGCETGCCGHTIALVRPDGSEEDSSFQFTHIRDGQDVRAWAEGLVTEEFGTDHVADLDWDNCFIESYNTCPM